MAGKACKNINIMIFNVSECKWWTRVIEGRGNENFALRSQIIFVTFYGRFEVNVAVVYPSAIRYRVSFFEKLCNATQGSLKRLPTSFTLVPRYNSGMTGVAHYLSTMSRFLRFL